MTADSPPLPLGRIHAAHVHRFRVLALPSLRHPQRHRYVPIPMYMYVFDSFTWLRIYARTKKTGITAHKVNSVKRSIYKSYVYAAPPTCVVPRTCIYAVLSRVFDECMINSSCTLYCNSN